MKAFSLVELSIVLVILGLLVGGILAGQSLIRASELRKHTAQIDQFQTVYNVFKDKYFEMPGDFSKARSFWPDGSCGTAGGVCNGSGDGNITNASENRYTWVHVSKAGLWPGSYYGWYRTSGLVNGYDFPSSAIGSNVGMEFVRKVQGIGSSTENFVPTGHYLHIGSTPDDSYGSGYLTDTDVILPQELWNIDTKMDDGLPRSGILQASAYCQTSAELYKLTTTSKRCEFWHRIGN